MMEVIQSLVHTYFITTLEARISYILTALFLNTRSLYFQIPKYYNYAAYR